MEKSNNAGKWLGKKRIKKFVKKCCFNCFNFNDAMGHKKVKLADAGLKPPHKDYKEFSDLFIYPGEYHFFVQW